MSSTTARDSMHCRRARPQGECPGRSHQLLSAVDGRGREWQMLLLSLTGAILPFTITISRPARTAPDSAPWVIMRTSICDPDPAMAPDPCQQLIPVLTTGTGAATLFGKYPERIANAEHLGIHGSARSPPLCGGLRGTKLEA